MASGAPRVLLIASLTVAVALAGCSAAGGPVHEEQPTWQSGYAWTYLVEEEESYYEEEDGERENGTEHRKWREVHEVLNTTQSVDGEKYYIVAVDYTGDVDDRSIQLNRHRDLGHLPYRMSISQSCMQNDCSVSFRLRDINTSTPTFLDFPLERGKRWGGTFTPQYSNTQVVFQAEVDGAYAVSTGLGTMEAARVSFNFQLANVAQLRQEILAEAREEGYKVDELRITMSQQELVYYSDSYQAVVRQDHKYEETFYARGTDPDGERFAFGGSFEERTTAVLEGARLLPRPERTMDQVAAFLTGQLDLRDPTGQSVVDAGYKLSVNPASAVVNAGIGEAASFNATVEGTLPDDHELHWRLVDEEGRTTTSGTGTSFAPAPTRPGAYTVELETRKGNASVAVAGATMVADWHLQQRVECPPVAVWQECVEMSVPVQPGVRSVSVRITPQETISGLGDQAYLIDSAGTLIPATRNGAEWTIDLEPVAGYLVDGDSWTLRFDRGVALLSAADLDVDVRYSSGSAVSVRQAESAPQLPARHVWDGVFS